MAGPRGGGGGVRTRGTLLRATGRWGTAGLSETASRIIGVMTPTLKRGTLTVGDHILGAWNTFKAKFWLFVLIALAPTALQFVLLGAFMVVLVTIASTSYGLESALSGLVTASIGLLIGMFFVSLYQYRCIGMMSLATRDLSEGREPTWADLHERTRGFMGRILLLLAALYAIVIIPVAGLVAWGVSFALRSPSPRPDEVFAAVGGLVLLAMVLMVVVLIVAVRLLYILPVMGIEQATGFAAVRRSWALTKGAFWPTLGYYLLLQVLLAVPASLISGFMNLALLPLQAETSRGGTPTLTPAIVVLTILASLVSMAVSVLMQPFSAIYMSVMYLSRLRQLAGEPPSNYVAPVYPVGAPYPPQPYPHQYPAQQPYPYPPQGAPAPYPPQGTPHQPYPPQPHPQQPPAPPAPEASAAGGPEPEASSDGTGTASPDEGDRA